MHARPVRFASRLALVGVILFFTLGIAMIARHMEKIITPTSAGRSESRLVGIPEAPNLPGPLVGEYWQDSAVGTVARPSWPCFHGLEARATEDGTNLKFCGDPANPTCRTEQSSNLSRRVSDTAGGSPDKIGIETPPGQNIQKTNDAVRTSSPAKQVLTKVRTKIKCVEAILKNAVIEFYYINGQIEGLRITGLDRISMARDLLLKNGDIIRAVNGHPLNSKRQAYEIFKRARTKPFMIVDLLQNGEAKTLLFDFR